MFTDLLTLVTKSMDLFILIFSRMMGMFFIAPMFSRNNIPATVKVGLSMIMSYIILPFIISETELQVETAEFIFLIVKEVFTGFCIGLCANVIFNIFSAAGANADIQIGLSMAQMMDTSTGEQRTVTGQLFNAFAFLIFFAVDAHHLLIKAIVNSFKLLPINTINLYTDNFISFVIKLYGYVTVASIQLVIPIIIVLFLGNVLLAFMSKVMPQMNVFIVGMPFKIIVGFMIFSFTLSSVKGIILEVLNKMMEYLYLFINIS